MEPDRGTREQAVERLEDLSFEGDGIAGRAETHTAGHYPIREFARGRAGPA